MFAILALSFIVGSIYTIYLEIKIFPFYK